MNFFEGLSQTQTKNNSLVCVGLDKNGRDLIINSARAIIYASGGEDFAQAAREATLNLKKEINLFRPKK